ncbi:hypothetical protein MTR_4g119130 [Medicago truncatula]|uniref:Uncharacterized protein n=1 Tax=Medicago truncatula TaxID=3880 RepID=G7JK87_MEDTR|nr:hypothetical protein MTR_4g119130 [Medicago truncatula]
MSHGASYGLHTMQILAGGRWNIVSPLSFLGALQFRINRGNLRCLCTLNMFVHPISKTCETKDLSDDMWSKLNAKFNL